MKPFYSVNFNARMCHIRISVNGIPFVSIGVDGQCSTRIPFNNLLWGSGTAIIRYEARPLIGEVQLHKEAYLSCEVELFDLDSPSEPIATMARYETPPQNESIVPYLMDEEAFQVSLPYSLVGWQQSVKLDDFQDRLRAMVFEKYRSIVAMIESHRFPQYEDAFWERENIMGVCFYLSEEEKRDRMKEVEDIIMRSSDIAPLSGMDSLEFAADGRLVRLVKGDGESSLRLFGDDEVTVLELWLHMKQGSSELTII